ncbi:MAG: NERD domain-containing protein [Pseudomonadales bacterium]|nr:NERD domain-containing protein [Pseudomonadales bacterium]
MKFFPNEAPDHNRGERLCWNLLKQALDGTEGVTYYRYPVFSGRGSQRREPDFLVVSRKYGVWVFECKGARLSNIVEIQGQEWQMRQWYDECITPVQQAEDQMWEVKSLVERDRTLRGLGIAFDYRVVLPFISEQEWQAAGFADHPTTQGVVLTSDALERPALRTELREHGLAHMPELSDEQWDALQAAFRGKASDEEPRAVADDTPTYSPLRTIRALQTRLKQLDSVQERVAHETPEGPQRIRGLAGTGKTVLFAKRAARMLAAHPDWEIAFVFYSRALYQQIRALIAAAYEQLTTEPLDTARIRIWHAWGGKDLTGLFREASLQWDERPLNLNDARRALGDQRANSEGFGWVCDQLEAAIADRDVEPFLDAVLIDEGQDLPPAFYRLAMKALRPPHRLYWAYDEAQGIGNLVVPRAAEVFGQDADGRPRVDLSGRYPSGIQKAHNLNRCYRTPAAILRTAHAFNMGLLRKGGPLQGVTNKEEWEFLGYEVEGEFTDAAVAAGQTVKLRRAAEACGHPYDDLAFSDSLRPEQCLETATCASRDDALATLTRAVAADLEAGLEPGDLLVTLLPGCGLSGSLVTRALEAAGVAAFEAGTDAQRAVFRDEQRVTVSSIFRAKGNEAWKVYAVGLHVADPERCKGNDDELVRRNQVFTALTRARAWCVAIGTAGPAMEELQRLAAVETIEFPAFNQRSLRRHVAHDESRQEDLFT